MLSQLESEQAAKDILLAESAARAISPISLRHSRFDLDDAYRIQQRLMDFWRDEGRSIAGYKIGLTSKAAQLSLRHAEPVYGRILNHAVFHDGARLPSSRFIKPRVEAELAFTIGRDINNPDATIQDVLHATDFIAPALEIIDHRIDPVRSLCDAVADNSGFAAAILSERRYRPDQIDARWVGAALSRNSVIEDTGVSVISMGHPAACVAWLASALAKQGGRLAAGDIVLSGAFTKAIDFTSGDRIDADFGAYGGIQFSSDAPSSAERSSASGKSA